VTTESKTKTDFRLPTVSKWRAPRAVADGRGGTIIATAEVAAPPERVFRALTTDEVERWWGHPDFYRMTEWTADLRVCGQWSVMVRFADGNTNGGSGEFAEIDAPRKIVMTRKFEKHPLLGTRETTLTYCLDPIATGTRVTVRDEGFVGRSEAAYGNAEHWERVLGWLDAYLSPDSASAVASSEKLLRIGQAVNSKPSSTGDPTAHHQVVSHDEWLVARKQLLAEEKEFTRLRDRLSQQRRDLPWEAVDKEYIFEGPNGRQTLAELFDGRSQLVVYHAMFDSAAASPSSSWTGEAACHGCSFWADNFNGIIVHLNHRDVTMVAVSRAPYLKIADYSKRMGWTFHWVSSGNTEFNFDYKVSFTAKELAEKKADYNYTIQDPVHSEREGLSVFTKDAGGKIFHTYSAYARGIDMLNVAYHYLDLVPNGRDEGDRGPHWVRRHDEYGS
jgi:predicted dithiol-disulfide oxidoreductase (DUF899 family)/uncharacterized protein YndB with AHSA1/START domain